MIRAKLLYAALIVVMVLFFVLYRGNLSLELLIFTLIFPVFLWISVVWLKHSVKASLYHSKEPILKGQIFQWVLQIKNKSIFASANAQITLEYRNSLTGKVRELTLIVPVVSRNMQRVRLGFHAVTCGAMQITVKKLVLYDALRLFRRTIRLNLKDTVVIMPVPTVLLPESWPPAPQPDADSNEYSKDRAGDDPSEIFDLHTYREGDPVSRIHWKLSSKLDTLMVKEYSLPLSAGCLLLSDYRHTADAVDSALRVDAMLSAMSAAAMQLSEQGSQFTMTSYHKKAGIQTSDRFAALSDAVQWLRHLVKLPPVKPDDRPALLHAIQEFLSTAHPKERVLIFTPQLDDPLHELLLALPAPERFTVFAVASAEDKHWPEMLGGQIRCVPVLLREPEHPSPETIRSLPEPDFDEETLVEGGADV